jgi:hypothetical protein
MDTNCLYALYIVIVATECLDLLGIDTFQFFIPTASNNCRTVLHTLIHCFLCLIVVGLAQGTSNGGEEIIKTGGV